MDRETLFDIGADRAGFFKSIFKRRAIFALAGFDSVYSGAWLRGKPSCSTAVSAPARYPDR